MTASLDTELVRFNVGSLWTTLQRPVLVAVAYFLAAEAAFFIGTLSDRIFAPFWPPNIVLFCALGSRRTARLVALSPRGASRARHRRAWRLRMEVAATARRLRHQIAQSRRPMPGRRSASSAALPGSTACARGTDLAF